MKIKSSLGLVIPIVLACVLFVMAQANQNNFNGTNGTPLTAPLAIAITAADVTCGTGGTLAPCTSATTITGLSKTLPLLTATWVYSCDIIYSQATANATNGMGVQTATNASVNLSLSGSIYTTVAASANASTVGVSSTTAQTLPVTPSAAVGTRLNGHFAGTIEGSSVTGTTFNVVAFTGSAADLLTFYRGSGCLLVPVS